MSRRSDNGNNVYQKVHTMNTIHTMLVRVGRYFCYEALQSSIICIPNVKWVFRSLKRFLKLL